MFNMGSAPSLADIAAVTKDGNGDGWGNGNGWWVLIILFAIFGGWGNGWGGQGRNGEGCATNGDLQRGFDTQSILNKLSGIDNGICDGFYAMNTSLLQSTNALQNAINKLELTASQCAQNQYLVNQLRPAAVPAFTVPNPYANYGFGCYCGSTNNGCC